MAYKFGPVATPSKFDQRYDALIDAGGNGDYTNIQTALSAGKRKLLIKPGTYTITSPITLNDGDMILMEGITDRRSDVQINVSLDGTSFNKIFDVSGITPPTNIAILSTDYYYNRSLRKLTITGGSYPNLTTLFSVGDIVGFGEPAREVTFSAGLWEIETVDSTSLTFKYDCWALTDTTSAPAPYDIEIYKLDQNNPPSIILRNLTMNVTYSGGGNQIIYDHPSDDFAVIHQKIKNVLYNIKATTGNLIYYAYNWGRVSRDSFFEQVEILFNGPTLAKFVGRVPNGIAVITQTINNELSEFDFSDGGLFLLGHQGYKFYLRDHQDGVPIRTSGGVSGADYYARPVILSNFFRDLSQTPSNYHLIPANEDFSAHFVGQIKYDNNNGDYFHKVKIANTTSSPVTITLPKKEQVLRGDYIIVKDNGNAATNNITVNTSDGTLIDGQSSLVINQNYASVTLIFDGQNWFVI
ncbi:MAG: hypothetical protein KatS3mg002_0293 [Candidatus Woesearchaeota archaeon]|nr:MAG: hypothetical protein KatS3mg002_0293 [Candidatus Woesearchaeota archaeon]